MAGRYGGRAAPALAWRGGTGRDRRWTHGIGVGVPGPGRRAGTRGPGTAQRLRARTRPGYRRFRAPRPAAPPAAPPPPPPRPPPRRARRPGGGHAPAGGPAEPGRGRPPPPPPPRP